MNINKDDIKLDSVKDVNIFGAKPLNRYTNGILKEGFIQNDWNVLDMNSNNILYQIHGAPHSEQDDHVIIKQLEADLIREDNIKRIILLHRPDEIQLRHSELEKILKSSIKNFGLVFLGNMHINDEFYNANMAVKKIIPHGFFKLINKVQAKPIIVGSHTSWGEMRSISHLFKLLKEIFLLDSSIVGYVGGFPVDDLSINNLELLWKKEELGNVEFIGIKDIDLMMGYNNTIIYNSIGIEPESVLNMTFNVQLYYLNSTIRTGESSGSVHSTIGIPVILEMNGSEVIEKLDVVKVQYKDKNDLNSIDFKSAALSIVKLIKSSKHLKMLENNWNRSNEITPKFVASEYINLFEEL